VIRAGVKGMLKVGTELSLWPHRQILITGFVSAGGRINHLRPSGYFSHHKV